MMVRWVVRNDSSEVLRDVEIPFPVVIDAFEAALASRVPGIRTSTLVDIMVKVDRRSQDTYVIALDLLRDNARFTGLTALRPTNPGEWWALFSFIVAVLALLVPLVKDDDQITPEQIEEIIERVVEQTRQGNPQPTIPAPSPSVEPTAAPPSATATTPPTATWT